MKRLAGIAVIAALLVGCSSGNSDAVNVPISATAGGNVVDDPETKKQLMGSEHTGGDQSGGELSGAPPTK